MIKKFLLITTGIISLGLGVIGILVPILPATPFILLSATCFLKSSSRLYYLLIKQRFLGKYIENYLKYKAITLRSKIISIVTLWTVIVISITLVKVIWLRLLLLLFLIALTTYLLRLKILKKDTEKNNSISKKDR